MNKEQLKWLLDEIDKKISNAERGDVCVHTLEETKQLIVDAMLI